MKRRIARMGWIKVKLILTLSALILLVTVITSTSGPRPLEISRPFSYKVSQESLKDSLDKKTGLIIAPGFNVVSTTCVRCHSPKLITEKRATREGWLATIRWMQQTQGLWDLGPEEPIVLDYLSKNYAPKNEGRRPLLQTPQWYKLEK